MVVIYQQCGLGVSMLHPVWARIESVVAELGDDPLYRSSGMAMELFHSNVLAWALRTHPEASAPLADLFGFPATEMYGIRREWRHLDMAVDCAEPGQGLILENKVTALPDIDQLARYFEDVMSVEPQRRGRSAFVLLSLLAPVVPLPVPWRRIDYSGVAEAMSLLADMLPSGFDADFVRRYARLARLLNTLVEEAGLDGHEDEPYFLDATTQDALRSQGVRDVVLKIRNVDLVLRTAPLVDRGPSGQFEVNFSNTQPLASYYGAAFELRELGSIHLGWQLQDRRLRLVALFQSRPLYGKGAKFKAAREKAAADRLGSWFDTGRLGTALPRRVLPYGGAKPFNHYDPNFVYRYGTVVSDVPPRELVQGLAALTTAADECRASMLES